MAGAEGTMFGKYLLLKKLESGGMGEIFLAKSKGAGGFEKLVVIKRILTQHVDSQEYLDMFLSEARLAAKFSHSNIVQVNDMGEQDGAFYHAMEYIHGKMLRDLIDRAKQLGATIPPALVIEIISGVCAGLSYAHNLHDMSGQPYNIIHRDINPHNVMISFSGDIKIIDFGIAKSEISLNKTETGTLKGKFVYMSPEQSAAEKLDKRSDLFSVGITMYEMMSFHNPFAKPNVVLSLDAIQRFEPPAPSTISPKYEPFDAISAKALAKKAADRYPDCTDLRNDLQNLLITGAVPRSEQSLADFMRELFDEQIEQANKELVELDKIVPVEGASDLPPALPQSQPTLGQYTAAPQQPAWINQSNPMAGMVPGMGGPQPYASPGYAVNPDFNPMYAGSMQGAQPFVPMPSSKLPLILIVAAILLVGVAGAAFIIKMANRTQAPQFAMVTQVDAGGNTVPTAAGGQPAGTNRVAGAQSADERRPVKSGTTGRRPAKKEHGHDEDPEPAAAPSGTSAVGTADTTPKVVIINQSGTAPAAGGMSSAPHAATPTPAAPAAPAFSGSFMVNSNPPNAQVYLNGKYVGQTPGCVVKLSSTEGTLKVGDDQTPYKIMLSYSVRGGDIAYTVDTIPWSIVKVNNNSLGKTPRPGVNGSASAPTRFEFSSPKAPEPMQIILRFKQ
jgi:serine/threonine protein kinase